MLNNYMIRPLLRIIPSLCGNLKLGCNINQYNKISDTEYIGICRNARIYPLDSIIHQKVLDVSLLNGSWEYDVSKFYNSGYSDIFFKDTFTFDKNNLLSYSDDNIVKDRNVDFEFGCKRVSYSKTGYQFCFFAPIYCDNVEDLPDYFDIDIDINNQGMYSISKKIRIDLTDNISYNYLNYYLKKYYGKIDDNVIFMLPATNQAVYYGIDVLLGGFNKYKDNLVKQLYTEETTINGYDACLANGFKRNNLILRQTMPLSFYFNISDILDDTEKRKFINSEVHIKGHYVKNGKDLNFYIMDENYDYLSLPVLRINPNTGVLEYQYINNNILALSDGSAIRTDNIYEYRFSNKLNKYYIRWKLKYSSDSYPYITNTNYNFSKNQDLYNLYYTYPQNYYWSSIFCNIDDGDINILLPLGDNIYKYYKDSEYLVDKYMLALNNYVSNWFDMTDSKDINYILSNTNWSDVHSDNKVFYKGLLYNFNNIYNNTDVVDKIDKFAILFYVDSSQFFTNNSISNYIYSKYGLEYTTFNNICLGLYSNDNNSNKIYGNTLYNLTDKVNTNSTINTNEYFTYNVNGTGKFIELEDLGIDFYEVNNYVRVSDLTDIISNDYINVINANKIDGYELLSISYLSNIFVDNSLLLNSNIDNLYFSYNNVNIKNKLSDLNITTDLDELKNSYLFYQNYDFISSYTANNLVNLSVLGLSDSIKQSYFNILNKIKKYCFYPKYILDNNKSIFNVFIPIDNHNKFYGNNTYFTHIENDSNVLYLDPFNIKNKLVNYYQLKGNIYIKDISNDYITLSDIDDTKDIFLYTNKYDRNEVLELLDYEHTYCMQEKYNYNKYNVDKFIHEINSIYVTYTKLKDNINITTYSLSFNYNEYNINANTYDYNTSNDIIICYSYNLDYTDKIITNNIKFIDNKYNHSSYIDGYFYVNDINLATYQLNLVNYNNDNIILQFYDLDELYDYAYNAHVVSLIDNKYMINQNCVGTYMFRPSYIFKHPKEIIHKIYNLEYIDNFDDDTCLIADNYKFDIYDFGNSDNYSNYKLSYFNYDLPTDSVDLQNIMFLYDKYNYTTLYGKFMNNIHLLIFIKYISEYALDKNNNEIDLTNYNINDYIYIKKNVVNTLSNNNIDINSVYIPLSDIFGNKYILDDIIYISDYIFKINGYSDNIELYFKKNFIKITKPIYENIISLNTNNYKDLYIYRLETDNDMFKEYKYCSSPYKYIEENYNIDTTYFSYYTYYTLSYSVVPFFDSIFNQSMESTILYKSYILNTLSTANYLDNNRNIKYTLYRYNCNDRLCLVDVSYIEDYTYKGTYLFRPNAYYPSFIYDKYVMLDSTSYSYTYNGSTITDIKNNITAYSYVASKIPTYDKIENLNIDFINITDNKEITFDSYSSNGVKYNGYKINTYTYNGITYGFYLNQISLKNINSIFNLTFEDYNEVKYFTKINGISIIDNHKYLTDNFKLLVPIIKYNILNQLYSIPIFNSQYKTVFKKHYINYTENNVNHILYDNTKNDIITLYRYYDSIVPYILETSNLYTEYALKTKILNSVKFDTNIYCDSINIYHYNGIRIYSDNDTYITKKQLEYKYFNDNLFINLEVEFEIIIDKYLTEIDLIKYKEESTVIKYFSEHINKYKTNKFNKSEILFLYKKYNVQLLSTPIKLDSNYKNKLYSLIYKFTLN